MEVLLSDLIFKHVLQIRLQGGGRNDVSDADDGDSQAPLVGIINNHMTTDLMNVTEAKDFLPIGKSVRCSLADMLAEKTQELVFPYRLAYVSSFFIGFWAGGELNRSNSIRFLH